MRKILYFFAITLVYAQNNPMPQEHNRTKSIATKESNKSKKSDNKLQENIKKQMKKEKLYKEEQKFYMGKDYNLTDKKIDASSLDKIKAIEPDYDYEMLEF